MEAQKTDKPGLKPILALERGLTKVELAVITLMLLAQMTIILVQVLARYVFVVSVPWTEEIVRYLLIMLTYIVAGAAITEHSHIEINMLAPIINKIKDVDKRNRVAQLSDILKYAVLMALSVFMAIQMIGFVSDVMEMMHYSSALKIPMWIIDATIAYGFVSLAVHCLLKIIISISDHSLVIDPLIHAGGDE